MNPRTRLYLKRLAYRLDMERAAWLAALGDFHGVADPVGTITATAGAEIAECRAAAARLRAPDASL